jgi:hypothetical protein
MVDRPVAVAPGALISVATTVAAHLARSAAPPAAVPATAAGSGADAASGSAAAGMQTRMSALSAQLSAKSPALQTTTAAGALGLETQDEQNSAAVRAVDIGTGFGGADGYGRWTSARATRRR